MIFYILTQCYHVISPVECSEPALSKCNIYLDSFQVDPPLPNLQNQTHEATSTGDSFVNKKPEVSIFMFFYSNFKD